MRPASHSHRTAGRFRRARAAAIVLSIALAVTVFAVSWGLGNDTQTSAAGIRAAQVDSLSPKSVKTRTVSKLRSPRSGTRRSTTRAVGKPRPLPGVVALEERASLLRGQRTLRRRAEVVRQKMLKRQIWRAEHAPFSIQIATFNVLGSQHSTPSGDHSSFPPASVRTARAVGYIARHGVDIIGAQELQADQLRQLTSMTGLSAYPGFEWGEQETDNSILYDDGVYEFVSGDTYHVTFVHRTRPQPILRLRDRATGREFYVLNTHTSPGGGASAGERYRAHATTSALVRQLHASGVPVLVTGDMNDRQEFYCKVVATGAMSAPQGGSYGNGCQPPAGHLAVDWVVGAGIDRWGDYWMDTSSVANKTSDHFFVSATAYVDD